MFKKGISLISLLIIVIVLGILSIIITVNTNDAVNNTQFSVIFENKTNVQKSVDKYLLENQTFPVETSSDLKAGKPQSVKWDLLVPEYLRVIPREITKIYYWVDYNGTVWISDIDTPKGIIADTISGTTTITWDEVDGAKSYEIGYIDNSLISKKNNRSMEGLNASTRTYKVLGIVNAEDALSFSTTDYLIGKTVVISSISDRFKSVPVGITFSNDILIPEKPISSITMSKSEGLTTESIIEWNYENSYSNNGVIEEVQWKEDGKITNNPSTSFPEGNHTIELRVKDNNETWSDWVSESFYVASFNNIKQLVGGKEFTLILMKDGTVKAWGYNKRGQLGDGTTTDRYSPVDVVGLANVKQLSAGDEYTIALLNDGTVKSWGRNNYGQLGDGTKNNKQSPIKINGLNNVKKISAGGNHVLALMDDGTVKAWGYNNYGQIGDGTKKNKLSPVDVNKLSNVIDISAGGYHSIALLNDGTVKSWGDNNRGQLGNGDNKDKYTPVSVVGLIDIQQIKTGKYHTLALTNNETLKSWGDNNKGQLGDGTKKDKNTPVDVVGLINIKQIETGEYHSLALTNDGTVKSWGDNNRGQLGDGTKKDKNIPVNVSNITNIEQIGTGGNHNLALTNTGTVKSWGENNRRQLGDGTKKDRYVPVNVIDF